MRMIRTLDAVDQAIVATLREHARTPIMRLARRVGLSRSATQERLRRLERDGTICGYTIRVPEWSAHCVRVWLFVDLAAGASCEHVLRETSKHGAIRLCHSLVGKPDLLALAELGSLAEVNPLREAIERLQGVARVRALPRAG